MYTIGHILTRPIRRALMFSLWIAFFIMTPAIILYTAGYRYDFKTSQIKQTGVLSVDILPRDATVTLNNIVIEKQIPIRLPNRAPGTYILKMERVGYKPWERDIVITSNNTTYIKDITLIKDALPIREIEGNNEIIRIEGYADTILILKKINGLYELHLHNMITNADTLIYRTLSSKEPEVIVSPYTASAYSRIVGEKTDTLYMISLVNPENPFVTEISSDATLSIDPTNPEAILYKKEGRNIHALSFSRNPRFIGTASSSAWYADTQGRVWEATESYITSPYDGSTYVFPDTIDTIIHINNSRIIATHADKTMIAKLSNGTIESIETANGTSRHYNTKTGEWLVWSPWELTSVYPDGGVSLLNRSGERIKEVTILDPAGVLLIATDNGMSAFNPGYYVRHSLAKIEDYELISVNIATRILYFFGTFAGHRGVYSLEY